MKIEFKHVLLIAVLTTVVALIASLVALPDNSGYAGLFFIAISPVFICVFMAWTYILLSAIHTKDMFRKSIVIVPATLLFEYFVAVIAMGTISSDSPNYNLNAFLDDCASLFFDKAIFFCTLIIATMYSVLLRYIARTDKIKESTL